MIKKYLHAGITYVRLLFIKWFGNLEFFSYTPRNHFGKHVTLVFDKGSNISFGRDVGLRDNVTLSARNGATIKLGDGVFLNNGCQVIAHHSIILEDNGNTGGGAVFHAPARIPIECLYHPDLSTIIAFFRYDMGSVFIQIENHSTGECDQVTVNALAGAMPFPISGSPGYWSISFLLCNGKEYCGEFEI